MSEPRQDDAKTEWDPRILILSPTDSDGRSVSEDYIPLMNCFFAAQKENIPIDVLSFGSKRHSNLFLSQAAYLTKGMYLSWETPSGSGSGKDLIHPLLNVFLVQPRLRSKLITPVTPFTDLRAACFCHGKIIDQGLVCSICLSIYCTLSVPTNHSQSFVCSTCHQST
jgi:transcription initiation factor TFIIH subunit 3